MVKSEKSEGISWAVQNQKGVFYSLNGTDIRGKPAYYYYEYFHLHCKSKKIAKLKPFCNVYPRKEMNPIQGQHINLFLNTPLNHHNVRCKQEDDSEGHCKWINLKSEPNWQDPLSRADQKRTNQKARGKTFLYHDDSGLVVSVVSLCCVSATPKRRLTKYQEHGKKIHFAVGPATPTGNIKSWVEKVQVGLTKTFTDHRKT